jgi:hypothetical protein
MVKLARAMPKNYKFFIYFLKLIELTLAARLSPILALRVSLPISGVRRNFRKRVRQQRISVISLHG